jgi:hypothetical protein
MFEVVCSPQHDLPPDALARKIGYPTFGPRQCLISTQPPSGRHRLAHQEVFVKGANSSVGQSQPRGGNKKIGSRISLANFDHALGGVLGCRLRDLAGEVEEGFCMWGLFTAQNRR